MPIHGRISFGGIEVRGFNQRYLAPVPESVGRDIFPGFAAVAGEVDETGVAAGPDQISVQAGGRDGIDDAVSSLLRVLDRGRAFRLLIAWMPRRSGQIRADDFPMQPAIEGLHYILCAEIKCLFVE